MCLVTTAYGGACTEARSSMLIYARSHLKAARPWESKEFLWCTGCVHGTPPPFLRRSAPPPQLLVLGQSRFKHGGAASHGRPPMHPAASCATRRALHAAARRGRTRREQEQRTARGPYTQAAGPHPQSTPTRTRAQHSRTHTHTHGAWHTAHDAGRAGGRARRVGASGGTAASAARCSLLCFGACD